jgi:hypothetical protein
MLTAARKIIIYYVLFISGNRTGPTAADTVRAPPLVRKRISAVLISPTRVIDTYRAREAAA